MEEVKKLLEQAFSAAAENGVVINSVTFDYEVMVRANGSAVVIKGQKIDADLISV